tara:strand:- start:213 stop:551 length:339 start_codon:yes stop_codon:yes gene_type:complete
MKKTKRYCLTLDLKNDPKLIEEYKKYHKRVWPEITQSLIDSGIISAEIYNISNRLTMILEVNSDFSFEKKRVMDENNPKVKEWEKLMWKYQKSLPIAKKGEKWILMEKIYQL